MARTLLDKIWDLHTVRKLPTGQTQIFIGLHLVHEVTTPQAFAMLRERGLRPAFPERIFGTMDHIIPTASLRRPAADPVAEEMMATFESNCRTHDIPMFGLGDAHQGIVHVIGPELGLTQPGMTIACGDSHTSTHGAFGALAFGIGTSQVRDVLASQCLAMDKPKLRRVTFAGRPGPGVTAKDLALAMIRALGVNGGVGFAYEYAGDAVARMTMDERMTLCNLSIEGGARMGYVNPDQTTVAFLKGRQYAPAGDAFTRASAWWTSLASDADARYDDEKVIDAAALGPVVTWGTNPGQSVTVNEPIPDPAALPSGEREAAEEAMQFMGFQAGEPVLGRQIDVAFIGSCTNSRLSDLRAAANLVRGHRVSFHVRALVVPGSRAVQQAAEAEGLDEVFRAAGFEWREPGCSLCLGMNDDKLVGQQTCASSSNRNFRGRQGSPTGRTLLMSPAMVAAAAIAGEVVDIRTVAPRGSGRMSAAGPQRIVSVTGRAIPLVGDDIDTDRIMPARHLRAITFDGLETHVFEDDRIAAGGSHAFDDARFAGASVMVVNRNFGCGSSREHAPQGLSRWGIRALVGESFSEILFGNAVMMGLPAVAASPKDIAALQAAVAADPKTLVYVNIEEMTAATGDLSFAVKMPDAARQALLTGQWDGLGLLLDDFDAVKKHAAQLPYLAEGPRRFAPR